MNWALLGMTVALVIGFGSSSRLASAYGIAVTSTMVITSVLFYFAARHVWKSSVVLAAGATAVFLTVELAFLSANVPKIPHGGWVPLVLAAAVYTVMATWKRGRQLLAERLRAITIPLEDLPARLAAQPPVRVPGTAVFMTGASGAVPPALVHNLAHNRVLHEKVILLTVITEPKPRVSAVECMDVKPVAPGIHAVRARYGFMQEADVPRDLRDCPDLAFDPGQATYFLGRETLLATPVPGMAIWREKLFAFVSRNALRATAYYRIPPDRVFEVGVEVQL